MATAVARCIAIIDRPLVFVPSEVEVPLEGSPQPTDTVDTALVIFPPSILPGGSETASAHAFVTGGRSMSAPEGNCTSRLASAGIGLVAFALTSWPGILYLSTPLEDSKVSPETTLQPYLEATLTLTEGDQPIKPLFSLFYTQLEHGSSSTRDDRLLVPQITTLIPECADSAAVAAQEIFRASVRVLEDLRRERGADVAEGPIPFWPPLEDEGSNDEVGDW